MKIYYTDKYNNEYGESHRLLEQALRLFYEDSAPENLGELIATMPVGDKGKPYIEGLNEFSISHTGNYWAVAIAETECGLDIQLNSTDQYKKVAERWYHPDELRAVLENGEDEFFRLWARRESLVKAVGTTVVNSDLPSTLENPVPFEGEDWIIEDIEIPGLKLHAALCSKHVEEKGLVEL